MADNNINKDKENPVKQDKSEDSNKTDLEKKNKTSQSKTSQNKTSRSKPNTKETKKSEVSKKVVTPKKRTRKRTGTTTRKRTKTTESKSKAKVEKKDTEVIKQTITGKKIEKSKEAGVKEKETTLRDKKLDSTSKDKKSNYQISLVDENLLSIKVTTEKAISVDCSVKDKKSLPADSSETQSNKILIHPKSNLQQQEVEIVVTIDPKTEKVLVEKKEGEVAEKTEASSLLIPNPDVADLIEGKEIEEDKPLTPDEILQEKLGRKNPYRIFRRVYQRNLLRGMVGALIIYFITVFTFYGVASKESSRYTNNEQRRLIVIQDLPEPKIKLENVEDPNKPEEVTDGSNIELRKLPPPKRNFKKRNITRPYKNPTKTDTNLISTDEELDSLRRLNAGILPLDSLNLDSNLAFFIPDSIRQNFSEEDIGLRMYFPNNWRLTDQRDINKNEREFKGVLLTDTTAKQEGTMTMFIFLDREGKEFRKDKFNSQFVMEDSTLTAYSKEPRNEGAFTYYSFYIFGKTDKLIVRADVRKQYFDKYKNIIEAVVRSIKIEKASSL